MNKSSTGASIRLETERPFYHPGDTVNGHIFLNFEGSDFPGNNLILKIKGKEETSWEEPNPNNPGVRETKRGLIIFYNHKINIYTWNEGHVPAGQYDFPFSFALKDFLPGSYSHRPDIRDRSANTEAVIKYKLKTECLAYDGDREMSKIKWTKELMVREKLKVNVVSKGEIVLPLSMMCCIGQGSCRIRVYFEKNAYESGEEANIFCEIDNSNGSQALDRLSFELRNKVLLRSDDGINREYSKTIFQTDGEGLAANQKAEGLNKRTIKLRLNSKERNEELKLNEEDEAVQLQESSSGQLINSSYLLEVSAKGSGFMSCKNEERALIPVIIYKKPKENKKMEGIWDPKQFEPKVVVIGEGDFYRRGKNKEK